MAVEVPANRPWTQEGYDARNAALKARREELSPLIAGVIRQAAGVYHVMRPYAVPVSKESRGAAVRYTQTFGLGLGGDLGGPVNDTLFVSLDEARRIAIKKEMGNLSERPLWKVERNEELDDVTYMTTTATEWSEEARRIRGDNLLEAEVARWRYGYVDGYKNCGNQFDTRLSSYFDGWVDLEGYMEVLTLELDESLD